MGFFDGFLCVGRHFEGRCGLSNWFVGEAAFFLDCLDEVLEGTGLLSSRLRWSEMRRSMSATRL